MLQQILWRFWYSTAGEILRGTADHPAIWVQLHHNQILIADRADTDGEIHSLSSQIDQAVRQIE